MAATDSRDHFDRWFHQQVAEGDNPPIHAATVVVVRKAARSDGDPLEVLMLRKNAAITFGGAWVFPGGRLDPDDYDAGHDAYEASAAAAVREAREEGDIELQATDLVRYSFWMPPKKTPKRFSTWFFLAGVSVGDVTIDDGEITDHDWVRPADMLERHAAGEVDLAPPTWVTLNDLRQRLSVQDAIETAGRYTPERFVTRMARAERGVVAMWAGDAGYELNDAGVAGERHRLTMVEGGWEYERTVPRSV